MLEYSGILILTTNRIGVIDEAFKSRIHVVMEYPPISLDSTIKMWNNKMDRLERDNKTSDIKILFDRQDLLDYAKEHYLRQQDSDKRWNGYEIRNAFQSALALGNYERLRARLDAPETDRGKKTFSTVKLSKVNFMKIADTAQDFDDYIVDLKREGIFRASGREVHDDNYQSRLGRRPRSTRRYEESWAAIEPQLYVPESPVLSKRASFKPASTAPKTWVTRGRQARKPGEERINRAGEDSSQEEWSTRSRSRSGGRRRGPKG